MIEQKKILILCFKEEKTDSNQTTFSERFRVRILIQDFPELFLAKELCQQRS